MVKALTRCSWAGGAPIYERYHDQEWGAPTHDAGELFELLILEGMQAGLSWLTILNKRRHMRSRFLEFSAARLARAGQHDVVRWLGDAGVIRHRGKLEGMIQNARATLDLDAHGGLAELLWSFVDNAPLVNRWVVSSDVPSETAESRAMSKVLKAQGFTFVGPTICYAFMQSAGLVNDHLSKCFRYEECLRPGIVRCVID